MSAPLAFLVTHHDVQNSFTLVLHVKLNMIHLYVVTFKHIVYFPSECILVIFCIISVTQGIVGK